MSLITRLIKAFETPTSSSTPDPATVKKSALTGTYGTPTNPPLSWFGGLGGFSSTGTPATAQTALQTPVYAVVRALSQDIARLPIEVRKSLPKGGAKTDRTHPVARLLRFPNEQMTAFELVSTLVFNLTLNGNAYAYIRRASDGTPVEIIPLVDSVSTLINQTDGSIAYKAKSPRFGPDQSRTIPAEDMIHLRNITSNGVTGLSPIATGQEVIGLSQAMQTHAGSVFRNGTMLRGLLTTDGTLQPQTMVSLAGQWNDTYGNGSASAHKVAVLEEGLKFQAMSMSPEDAQLLDSRKNSVEEVARHFRMPLNRIGIGPSNAEDDDIYVNSVLYPLVRMIEETLEMRLFLEADIDDYTIRFNLDAMLRADLKTRYDCYQTGLLNGLLCINECREQEGLPPVDHGDDYRVPLNQAALDSDSAIGTAMTDPKIPKPDNQLLSEDKPVPTGEDA